MSKIFESHAHYEDEAFDEDREELIASLPKNGIEYVVNVGSTPDTCRKTVELTRRYDFIYGALGIHPSEIRGATDGDLQWIEREAAGNPKIAAIGEIGLDYHWDKDNKKEQKDFFQRQTDIARRVGKPIIVHSRDAAKDTYECMRDFRAADCGGVVHCFSYSACEAGKYLDMGFYIGLGGAVTFKNAAKVKEVASYVPIDRILLETDCPYMAPEPYRGRRNSSLYIPEIAKVIATLKNMEYEEVIAVTEANARLLYGIKGGA